MRTIVAIALVATVAIAGTSVGTARAQDDDSPKQDYMVYCAECHGPGGHGDGANASTLKTRPRDFGDCKLMKTISDNTMFEAIKDGGSAGNLPGDMPPWGQAFEDSEIKGLVAFVRTFCKK
jgi:mono/diheme cytochrome c family protein